MTEMKISEWLSSKSGKPEPCKLSHDEMVIKVPLTTLKNLTSDWHMRQNVVKTNEPTILIRIRVRTISKERQKTVGSVLQIKKRIKPVKSLRTKRLWWLRSSSIRSLNGSSVGIEIKSPAHVKCEPCHRSSRTLKMSTCSDRQLKYKLLSIVMTIPTTLDQMPIVHYYFTMTKVVLNEKNMSQDHWNRGTGTWYWFRRYPTYNARHGSVCDNHT